MKTAKLLATLGFISLCLALWVIASTPLASGYEISIYSAYPPHFWFFLISSLACGLSILVLNAIGENPSRWWLAGLSIILLATGIFLLLPIFRGYAFYGQWDPLCYLGHMKDIELTGHFGAPDQWGENFYPALHIVPVSLSYVTGLDAKLVAMLFQALSFCFYIVSIYLLARVITGNQAQALIITTFGSFTLYTSLQSAFYLRTITFLLLPFILYLYYQGRISASGRVAYSIAFLLVLLSMPFFHPAFGGVFLFGVFLCLEVSLLIYGQLNKRWLKRPALASTTPRSSVSPIPLVILLVILYIWFGQFQAFRNQILGIREWFVRGAGIPEIERLTGWVSRAGLSFGQTIEYSLRQHGVRLLYVILAGIVTMVVWKRLITRSEIDWHYVVFSSLFFVFALAVPLSTFIGYMLAYDRVLLYAIFAATILNGLGLHWLLQKYRRKVVVFASIALLIMFATLSIFNVNTSPLIKSTTQQVTAMDLKGTRWFLDYRDEELPSYRTFFVEYSHVWALTGFQAHPKNIVVANMSPVHFGYDQYQMYGESCESDNYFLNNRLSRLRDPEIFPELEATWRWTPSDYEQLEQDPSVARIYHNGEFEVFHITRLASSE